MSFICTCLKCESQSLRPIAGLKLSCETPSTVELAFCGMDDGVSNLQPAVVKYQNTSSSLVPSIVKCLDREVNLEQSTLFRHRKLDKWARKKRFSRVCVRDASCCHMQQSVTVLWYVS